MWQERLPSYPAIVVPPGRMQLCSGTLITGLSFILPASLLGALLRCHVGGFCVYLRSRQFFTAYLCQSLRSAVSQVGGSLLWWLGWAFARDTILSAAKRDQCTSLNPLNNCIIKTGSCSIVLISLIFTPFFLLHSLHLAKLFLLTVTQVHSGTETLSQPKRFGAC